MNKEKCPYCDYKGIESNKNLAHTIIDLNYLEMRASTWLSCNRTDIADGDTPHLMIDVSLISDGDEVIGQADSIPANYCPVCGRYLLEDAPEQQQEEKITIPLNLTSIYDLGTSGELSVGCANSLIRSGIIFLEDLSYIRDEDLKSLKGIGNKAYEYIVKAMENRNLAFAETDMIKDKIKTIRFGKQIKYLFLYDYKEAFKNETCYLRDMHPATPRRNTYLYSAAVADNALSSSVHFIHLCAREIMSIKEVS